MTNIDDITEPSEQHNKCLLLNEQLMNIEYKGGETYTAGAFQKAKVNSIFWVGCYIYQSILPANIWIFQSERLEKSGVPSDRWIF